MPCKQAALSKGALLGKPGGGSFTRIFERKKKCISGFIFFDPEGI
jgi:hypothetical protein